jgi:murein DD-endopeptidase MepM/ murein hydrolase activator NlpD
MNIILIPGGRHTKGVSTSLHHRHVLLILGAFLALAVLLGSVAYRIHALVERSEGPAAALVELQRELAVQRLALKRAERDTQAHLNALAQRLGSLQAQVLRLNALGQRLTRMAGLDAREFSFESAPAMGGPEKVLPESAAAAGLDLTTALAQLAESLAKSEAKLRALEGLMLDRTLSSRTTPSGWPVDGGWVSSPFGTRADPFTGQRSWHEGVDIAARFGAPVYAAGDGVVNFAGEKAGYGLLVEVTHESGLVTRYAHTAEILVKVGDRVRKGQPIARVGSSGRSTGPHLHFEVVRNDRPVNPASFLQQQATAH